MIQLHSSVFKYILITICLHFLFACAKQKVPEPNPAQIIPEVVQIESQQGYFEITPQTTIAVEDEAQEKIARQFFSHFETVAGWLPSIKTTDKGSIVFKTNSSLPKEGYELISTTDGIRISASQEAGFFYALQTLKQLLPTNFVAATAQDNTRWVIPMVKIADHPRFGWRGFMLDVSRHFYDKETVKEVLDQMADLKLNTFHWHLTDDQGWRIEIKKYPKLTSIGAWRFDANDYDENNNNWWGRPTQQVGDKATYGGFYTQEDVKEIIAYAKERYITVVPEIDVPGHSQAIIAAYPEVACTPGPYYVATGGAFKYNTLCPGKEVTFEFVENVLNEVMDLFPSQYVHVGGDECNKSAWKKDPDCQNRIRAEGLKDEKELQSYFIKRVEKIVNAKGKNLIGWDEILEGGLAPNATVMSWRGEEGGIKAAKQGHKVIMTPSKYVYLDLKQGHTDHEPNLGYSQCLLSACYNYNPVPESLQDKEGLILGIQGNLWSESLSTWDKASYMMYPRLYAVAENAWSPQSSENWDDFIVRLYPQMERLNNEKIRFATSAFNVWIEHHSNGDNITIDLHTEANGLDIRYTLDGAAPDTSSLKYVTPFQLKESAMVRTAAFRNGKQIGKVTEKQFYIHKAKGAKVVYHNAYKKSKTAGGNQALTDLNYGSNWIVDSLWQGFVKPMVEFDVLLDAPTEVNAVQLNFLQVAISGLYMPENIQLYGSADGKQFDLLKEESLLEPSRVQGRYIHRAKMEFSKKTLKALKIKAKAVNPIPKGHHRQGELSQIYIDEVIVF